MKKKIILLSILLLISTMIAGGSMAWFLSSSGSVKNDFKMQTLKIKVLEPGFEDLTDVKEGTYEKSVQVQSLGTKKTYIRVRLVASWSNPSLPVSNVSLNLNLENWTDKQSDGYYYFKYYLSEGQITSKLLESVSFTNLSTEYKGVTFNLKVAAEGVQKDNSGWKDVWGISNLPFFPDQAWTP